MKLLKIPVFEHLCGTATASWNRITAVWVKGRKPIWMQIDHKIAEFKVYLKGSIMTENELVGKFKSYDHIV